MTTYSISHGQTLFKHTLLHHIGDMSYIPLDYISSDSFPLAHLSQHGVDCSGQRTEEIPEGSFCFQLISDDFYFPRHPDDEQLLVLPVMIKNLRMSVVEECRIGVRLPEDSVVLQMQ